MKILNDFVMTHTDINGQTSLLIHLDCGCNLNCYQCYNYQDLVKNSEKMEWASTEKLFNFLRRDAHMFDYLIISGGEPTLFGITLIEFCQYLKDNFSIKLALNTNGTKPAILKKLIYGKLIDSIYLDLKFPILNYNFNYYKNLWSQIYGVPFNQKIYDDIKTSIELLYKSFIHFEMRTVKYPFLKPNFLKKYKETVENYNDIYGRNITHNFNDFYQAT